MSSPVPATSLSVGSIIGGLYIDMSPRWYIIEKITPKTMCVRRLKYKKGPLDRFGNFTQLPSESSYGEPVRMSKSSEGVLTYQGSVYVEWTGDYDSWFSRVSDAAKEKYGQKE